MKGNLINLIKEQLIVGSLTTDFWTSRAGDSYLGLTLFFINENFDRHYFTLGTFPYDKTHTA
jgi:hypothetical protein